MDVFYEVRQIPAHSCLMMDSEAEARAYPRRDLALGYCRACGFVSNVLYDESVKQYSDRYEDQQSFSPRFRAFQTELVRRLVERYDIRGKDVLEIGCGKGDFLVELCQAGANRGLGIDPACIPGRVAGKDGGSVRFIADYYGEKYADLPCDVVCCRHTLEHIHETREFMQIVRRTLGERPDTLVFFEVPDVRRVLHEQAFWDIYYEHCSYFSLGSLARLFRSTGFDVIELATDFDDQYLLLVARPAAGETAAALPEEQDLDLLAADVQQFRSSARRRIEGWQTLLAEAGRNGKRVAIWGSGSKCVAFLSTVGLAESVKAVVDINPYRHGRFLAGLGCVVSAPETLKELRPDLVLVMNPIYRQEITEQLRGMGLEPEVMPV